MADPVESVISNDDLLTEILVRLPLLSLFLFKSVSKHWYSLIKQHAANDTFCRKLDPPSGLLLEKKSLKECHSIGRAYSYDFVPLDNRIPYTNFTTFGPEVLLQHNKSDDDVVRVLDSCNGLLLCRTTYSTKVYVCNPSVTNMFKLLPEPDKNVTFHLDSFTFTGGLKLAFDPTKSPHYKVVYAELVNDLRRDKVYQIHTFSSQTGNWSLCGPQFTENGFYFFGIQGVYWNDAIYWRNACRDDIFKFDIMNEPPVLTTLPTPLTLDLKVHHECRLFESRGCLLLACKEDSCSRHFTIYEKGNVYSEWSVKYIVNIDDIIKSFPESWYIYRTLYCIVLEEREEDSFLVMKLDKKVVQYKIVSKTLSTISELGPNDDDFFRCCEFIPSFAKV